MSQLAMVVLLILIPRRSKPFYCRYRESASAYFSYMMCDTRDDEAYPPCISAGNAAGSGKTCMACAFGMEACKHCYTVRYVPLLDLLLDLQAARDNSAFTVILKKYTKPVLLLIDEWLLLKLMEAEAGIFTS